MAIKSKRSAQMAMAKLNRAYEAEILARNAVIGEMQERGVCEDTHARIQAHEAKMREVFQAMATLKAEASAAGHYVTCSWLKWFTGTTGQLIRENRD